MKLRNKSFTEKNERLASQLNKIELEDVQRKALIRSCLLKGFELCARNKGTLRPSIKTKTTIKDASDSKTAFSHKTWANPSRERAITKLNEYERRIFVLKLELSTKEQAHEAKIDQLNGLIDRLQTRIDEIDKDKQNHARVPLVRPHTSPLVLFTQTSAARSFLTAKGNTVVVKSPFAESMSKDGFLAGSDLAKIASKATLKLSKDKDLRKGDTLFSPSNSSAESTPLKASKTLHINLSSSSLIGPSDADDTFQTANGTFAEGVEKKTKRRVRLLSSQASKVSLSDPAPETEDVNSLDYYLDANFAEDISPLRTNKRPLEDGKEPSTKKRHVFKIE